MVSAGCTCPILTEGEYAVGPSITYQEEEIRMKSTSRHYEVGLKPLLKILEDPTEGD